MLLHSPAWLRFPSLSALLILGTTSCCKIMPLTNKLTFQEVYNLMEVIGRVKSLMGFLKKVSVF